MSAFVFTTQIVHFLFFLNVKFQASSLICVGPVWKPHCFLKRQLILSRQSQREYDAQQKHQTRVEKKDKKVIESTIALSKAEVEQLEREKQSEQEKLNVVRLDLYVILKYFFSYWIFLSEHVFEF